MQAQEISLGSAAPQGVLGKSACVMVTVVSKLLCVPSVSESRMKTTSICRSCSKAQVVPSLEDGEELGMH